MKKLNLLNVIVISASTLFGTTIGTTININPCLSCSNYCAQMHATTTQDIQKNISCNVVLDFSNMGFNKINSNFAPNSFIKALDLKYNNIHSFQENTFISLSNLETLDLSNNKLMTENLFSFGKSHALKSLTLDYNPYSSSMEAGMPVRCDDKKIDGYRRDSRWSYNDYDDRTFLSYDERRDRGSATTFTTTTTTDSPFDNRNNYKKCSEDQYYTDDGEVKNYSTLSVRYTYPNLTHLSIRKICINNLASNWAHHFPNLSHLDMSENYFHKTSKEVFSRLPASVISLTIRNAKLTTLDSSHLKNITHLNLNGNEFEAVRGCNSYENSLCLQNLINLERLHIANCSIQKIETGAFQETKKLKYLDISNNNLKEISDGALETLTVLSYLNLSKNKLYIMPNLSFLQNLTSLYMDNIENTMSLSIELESFPQLPKLEVLSFRSNELTQIPSSLLNKLPKLIELNLSHNRIASLPSWQGQTNLQRLLLGSNNIENFEDILLKNVESLELINLENNKFTEIKVKFLKHLPEKLILKL